MLKVDLHLHTAEDPVDNIDHDAATLVDRAAALGFDAIAITLHDRQFADDRLVEYARERRIVLLPGIERTIARRHVLLINFPHAAEAVTSFEDVAALKRSGGGIVIAPHAFFPGSSCLGADLDRYADLFDGVEWSYFWTRGANFNARAARWAAARGKPIVGSSDLHHLRQLGRTYSLVAADRNADAICDAIRRGRVLLHTEPVPVLELARTLSSMLLRGRKSAPRLVTDRPVAGW